MSGRMASATEKALAQVKKGKPVYAAAKACGVSASGLYKVIKRIGVLEAQVSSTARTPVSKENGSSIIVLDYKDILSDSFPPKAASHSLFTGFQPAPDAAKAFER